MHLKTFVAKDMPAALAQVRRELGQDAVVLHTRMIRRGGVLGLFQKTMVEITAADKALVAKYRQQRAARAGQPVASSPPHGRRTPAAARGADARGSSAAAPAAGDLIRKTYAAAMVELQKHNASAPSAGAAICLPAGASSQPAFCAAVPAVIAAAAAPVDQAPAVVPIAAAQEQLTQEMRTVQRLVGKMIRRRRQEHAGQDLDNLFAQEKRAPGDLPDPLMDQYLAMMKQEVAEEIAEEILGEVGRRLPGPAMHDAGKVRAAVLESVAKMIPVDPLPMSFAQGSDGRMRVVALVGPTGVGKTTTVAKLAANLKLRQKKNVGLVTIDTYRIAAVEQLRTYAQIIGVPLEVAASPAEVSEAMSRCRRGGCQVVLVDTAGRSQRDDPKLRQLGLMLQAAQPDEVHLVLSSTCTQSVLEQAVERFSRLRTDRIIFTKLDEAVSFGVLLNVSKKLNKRLSFVTTGQEVPHDIEPGRAQRLAALVLGEGA